MTMDPRALLGAMVKSQIAFSQVVLQDLGNRCRISTSRDFKTVTARIEHEGDSFLTITLPKFGKDFQKSLDRGFVGHDVFLSFKKHGGLPRFLGGFLDLVFDRESGRLLDDPSVDAIYSIHQFSSMFGKIFEVCSDARVEDAMASFIKCEQDIRKADAAVPPERVAQFNRIGSMLFRDMLTSVDRQIYDEGVMPKHGPGNVAERLTANGKYMSMTWTSRLEELFPFGEYLFPNHGWYQNYPDVEILEPGAETPVRVVPVPKTAKSPRIIAIEPTWTQYVQQGILEMITEGIQRDDLLKDLLGNLDQEPNRRLAREGSISGTLATLDLSEASDRVSNQLVRGFLAPWRTLHDAVDATRSRKADVPGHGVIRLAKFASMGSALCFIIEGIVFTTIVFSAIEHELNRPLTRRDVESYRGRVRVYGDDIIVPVDMVDRVIDYLESFGLKVNTDKSFWSGSFRESCGGDYYNGFDITPVKVRSNFPLSRKDVDAIISTVSLRNQLFVKGFEEAVGFLDGILLSMLKVFPLVPVDSDIIGRWTYDPVYPDRVCPELHRPLIKAPVLSSKPPRDPLGEHGALMKAFLKRSDLPFADREHLLRSGRAKSSDIKLRWVPLR